MTTTVYCVLLLVGILVLLKFAFVLFIGLSLLVTGGALFVPTPNRRIDAALDLVSMQPGEVLLDLGCGDGKVLVRAKARYGVTAWGIEVNPLIYLLARARCALKKEIKIQYGNFWKVDIGRADVVFCYLFPDVLAGLGPKLVSELRPGTKVVSFNFPIPGWKPSFTLRPHINGLGDPIYLYTVGEHT